MASDDRGSEQPSTKGNPAETPDFQDHSKTNERAFELPEVDAAEFAKLFRNTMLNPNLGAGVDVSGASGSGKSNLMEWSAIEAMRLGLPVLVIDPHGDSSRKILRNVQALPPRARQKVLYLEPASPACIASINPLRRPPGEDRLSDYEQKCFRAIQIEITAEIILAAVGEAGSGFGFRPVLKKWITRWLTILYDSKLPLPCASMLLDPNHPVYQQLLKLVGDDLARFQMESLANMRPTDQEAEIGSARNRFLTLIGHPATVAFLSRTENALDFDSIYKNDVSIIVNLAKGNTLTDETQKMFANSILTQYLQVVFATPESQRRRRLCLIDELPIFVETCAPMLERCCTEIRKYKTSFMLLHQGANRFPDRTNNPFLLTILDMCRTKVFFRHGIDREFFGGLVSSAAGSKPVVKHLQVAEQQFQEGYDILNLVDTSEGHSNQIGSSVMDATSSTSDAGSSITETLKQATESVRQTARSNSQSQGTSNQRSETWQNSHTSTSSTTYKQTAVAKLVSKLVVTGVQFYSPEERDRGAIDMVAQLDTGEAIFYVEGSIPPVKAMTPLAKNEYGHAIKYGQKKVTAFLAEISKRSEFDPPAKILQEHQQFIELLLKQLYSQPALPQPSKRRQKPVQGELLLPQPPKSEDLEL